MSSYLKTYFSLTSLQRVCFWQAVRLIIYYTIIIKITPSSRLHRYFYHAPAQFESKPGDSKTGILIKDSIRRANKALSMKNNCLVLSLTARELLHRENQPVSLYLGLKKSRDKNLVAHSWTKSGDIIITGRKGMKQFTKVEEYRT